MKMNNVKHIKEFMLENSDMRRLSLYHYPDEIIKIPPPFIVFSQYGKSYDTFECISLKTFIKYIVRVTETHLEICTGGKVNTTKCIIGITSDKEVFAKDADGTYNQFIHCTDNAYTTCMDILDYIRIGVRMYYHNKEENNEQE